MRRLCIYFFYDDQGIVDEYVFDCLDDLAKHVERIVFVSNSPLAASSRARLANLSSVTLTERTNIGFDVWAYKHGLEFVGWDEVVKYDEVIFMNFTIVGPLYPLAEMFGEMDKRSLDFWGMHVHSGESYDPWGVMADGYIPKHLQSHFIAVRRALLSSVEFRSYWDTMRPVNTYYEAIGFHEAVFTPKFAALGYRWASYIDTKDLERLISYPLMFMPREILIRRRSPFFKRKALILPMREYMGVTRGDSVSDTLECLVELDYDVEKALPSVLRAGNQRDIRRLVCPISILCDVAEDADEPPPRIGQVVFADRVSELRALAPYVEGMVESGALTVVAHPRVAERAASMFSKQSGIGVVSGGPSDAVGALFDLAQRTDVVGFIGFGNYTGRHEDLAEYEHFKSGLDALFANRKVINAATRSLVSDGRLGAYAAPQSSHGGFGAEFLHWRRDFRTIDRLLTELEIKVHRDAQTPADSTESMMFWLASAAIRSIDSAKILRTLKPMRGDRGLRIFGLTLPLLVQSQNRLMSYAAPVDYVANLVMAASFERDRYSTELMSFTHGAAATTDSVEGAHQLESSNMYYEVDGTWSERNKVVLPLTQGEGGVYSGTAVMPSSSAQLRFDPVEGSGVLCRGLVVRVNGTRRKATPMNGIAGRGFELFFTVDSQYAIHGGVEAGDRVTVELLDIARVPVALGGTVESALAQVLSRGRRRRAVDRRRSWVRLGTLARRILLQRRDVA